MSDESLAMSVLGALPETSVLVFDTSLRFFLSGGEALARHGFSPAELKNRRCAEVIPADRWALYEPLYRAALLGESNSVEVDAIDGNARYVVNIGPLRAGTGAVIGGLVIARDVSARRDAEDQLEQSRQLLQDVLDSLTTAVSVKDADRRFILINRAYEEMHTVSRDQMIGKSVHDLYVPELADDFDADDVRALETGNPVTGEHLMALADGSTKTFLMDRSPLRDRNGDVYGLCAAATDITERTRMEHALQEAKQVFEQALEHAPIGMALVTLDGRLTRVNRAFRAITGYSTNELTAKTLRDITHPDDIAADLSRHERLITGEISDYQTERRCIHAGGHTVWVRLSASLVRSTENEPQYVITQVQDISEQRRMEKELRHLADHDSLTGLPNRRFFEDQLGIQIGRCKRYGENAALLLIDLDGFKQVNDQYGHKAGDELLKEIARAIDERIRATDTAARIGGDEFAALLLNTTRDEGPIVTEMLRQTIADTTVEGADGTISLKASVGIAILDDHAADPETAFGEADAAMYSDKSRNRG